MTSFRETCSSSARQTSWLILASPSFQMKQQVNGGPSAHLSAKGVWKARHNGQKWSRFFKKIFIKSRFFLQLDLFFACRDFFSQVENFFHVPI